MHKIPPTISHYYEFDIQGQGYNKEVMPSFTPIKLYDLTIEDHRIHLKKVFDGEVNALVSIIGAPDYVIIPFKHRGTKFMKRSALMYNQDGTKCQVDPYEQITPEEFFEAIPHAQAQELLFFLDQLTTSGGYK